jgi:hypothetical protein
LSSLSSRARRTGSSLATGSDKRSSHRRQRGSGTPVHIGAARAQFLPRLAVSLQDIRVGDPAQLTLAEVDLASDLRPLLSGQIENADVTISGSRIDLPLPFGLPQSSDQGDAAASSEPAVRIVSIRSIALRSVRLRSRGREIVVSADSAYGGTALACEERHRGNRRHQTQGRGHHRVVAAH